MKSLRRLFRFSTSLLLCAILLHLAACRSEYKRRVDKAKQLVREERYEEAIKEFELAAQADPKQPRPHYGIAKIYKNRGRYAEAAQNYRKAIEVNADYVDAYADWVKVVRLAGQLDEAAKIATDAMQRPSVKADMTAMQELQQEMAEVEKARKAKAAGPAAPSAAPAPKPAAAPAPAPAPPSKPK